MMAEREYVVSLHDHKDLTSFYGDMETPGGNLYIPNRAVPVHARRPISKNTHYLLTEQEAETIRHDPRVAAVELSLKEQGAEYRPCWTQISSFWNKSSQLSNTSMYPNWGLLRCTNGSQIPNWGSDGVVNQSATIKTTSSGQGVDVVVIDGHMDPDHPEFSRSVSGIGESRVNQFNWLSLTPLVDRGAAGTYQYAPYVDPTYADIDGDRISDRTFDNDHGCHVAGIVAGNTQGWARDSIIYNISPYRTSPSYVEHFMDYVRVWHSTKSIEPYNGIKRPTIVNLSAGIYRKVNIANITQVAYRGVINSGPFTSNQLQGYGIYNADGFARVSLRNSASEIDIQEAMAAGVIVVGAAGNDHSKISLPSSDLADDYNNYFVDNANGLQYSYYNRGTVTSAPGVVTVGSVGATAIERKATYSNCGPRVDVYAPGTYITSSINSDSAGSVTDRRNIAFYQNKYSGTSVSAPQVAGVLACLAETWPNMTQAQALEYVTLHAKQNQITATTGGPTDFTDLQGSYNRYLCYVKERPESGQVYPKVNQGNRKSTGMLYPRPKIYRYGR